MKLIQEKNIEQYDPYRLGMTKDYLVLNDNYTGIVVFDRQLEFVKKIEFADDLRVAFLYTSLLNNMVVIFDAEYYRLYIINIDKETINSCEETNLELTEYYRIDDDSFFLADEFMEYEYSFSKCKCINQTPLEKRIRYYCYDQQFDQSVYYDFSNDKTYISKSGETIEIYNPPQAWNDPNRTVALEVFGDIFIKTAEFDIEIYDNPPSGSPKFRREFGPNTRPNSLLDFAVFEHSIFLLLHSFRTWKSVLQHYYI